MAVIKKPTADSSRGGLVFCKDYSFDLDRFLEFVGDSVCPAYDYEFVALIVACPQSIG